MIEKETAIQGYFFFWSSSSLSLRKENFPENYNYNMVFIGGGGGGPGELAALSSRKEFLLLLVSDDFNQLLDLSRHVITQMTEHQCSTQ